MVNLKNIAMNIFSIKYGALALLVLQNTFLVVFMRYSRTTDGPLYATSTAVVMMEVVKFVCCAVVIMYQSGGINQFVGNNLLYFALSHLDAATYQVCYQSKILTTALFSVVLLNRQLSWLQWLSLVVLTAGVSLAQLSTMNGSSEVGADRMGVPDDRMSNSSAGFLAVLCAAVLSGFAGVYFERILKGSTASLWLRNLQMGLTTIPLALGGVFFSGDRVQVVEHGFFYGYNMLVVSVILLQAVGGLVVAVVVKYADNILKGFASSFSIITSCILCIYLFDFNPTLTFLSGAVLVNISMYLYTYSPPAPQAKTALHSKRARLDSDDRV